MRIGTVFEQELHQLDVTGLRGAQERGRARDFDTTARELLAELQEISDEWLTMMHGREKRFSLGWFNDDYIRYAPVIAIHTPVGNISAFANIVPEYQLPEITTDLMRRRRNVEGGSMDLMKNSIPPGRRAILSTPARPACRPLPL